MNLIKSLLVGVLLLSNIALAQSRFEPFGKKVVFSWNAEVNQDTSTVISFPLTGWEMGKLYLDVLVNTTTEDWMDSLALAVRPLYGTALIHVPSTQQGIPVAWQSLKIWQGGDSFADFDFSTHYSANNHYICSIETGGMPPLQMALRMIMVDSTDHPTSGSVTITLWKK